MAHYAKVVDGIVTNVIVAEASYFDTFIDDSYGEWIQTSYNTLGGEHTKGGKPLRKNYASVGGNYDKEGDFFYDVQPFPSWTLNKETWSWEAPVAKPTLTEEEIMAGKNYIWNEDTKEWVEVV